jgi:hypothetical protein
MRLGSSSMIHKESTKISSGILEQKKKFSVTKKNLSVRIKGQNCTDVIFLVSKKIYIINLFLKNRSA